MSNGIPLAKRDLGPTLAREGGWLIMSLEDRSRVLLTASKDRGAAVKSLFEGAGLIGSNTAEAGRPDTTGSSRSEAPFTELAGKSVAIKANFNSADPFPASTHLDTLRAIVDVLNEAEAARIVLAERSGMGDTRENLERLGLFALSGELGFEVVVLDEEPKDRWLHIERGETHWLRGFYLAKVFLEADVVIQTCCAKTHRYGGHFTMSLKNSVGLVAKRLPGGVYDYMGELHVSPYQRLMIAEVNNFYPVDLVVMDAAKVFVSGGPDKGTEAEPGLMLASRDRVAIDAAGVALLREYGMSKDADKPIFQLDQLRRAAELGVGAASASAIDLVPLDERGREAAERIRAHL